jgi:soluble lytic murein transglycosylase-like protein
MERHYLDAGNGLISMTPLPPDVARLIDAAAMRYAIAPAIARAVAWVESGGRQSAVGTSGELGVMQLMPATAELLEVDPRSLPDNIEGGVRYLAQMIARFGFARGIAGYNGGPGMALRDESEWPLTVKSYVAKVRARSELEARTMLEGARIAAAPFVLVDEVTPRPHVLRSVFSKLCRRLRSLVSWSSK